ncbi:MBOAT family O-acyltransferase [Natronincola ferrireducens]|uniref:Alginate O-acetyltransferase complex protein AlgI n=1 Tax=Natronincola ferrireducens TaxID=393762 RepID=A0A1G8Z7W1_9FIRM|nr:MBOAT family O-acyltransferase [Natronincola ferrireducens]SDK10505.1 alginate O-acetyltransferase complex protein AlgI [Natronincola ferrireducens]
MVFSSLLFLFRFLPIALGIYYVTPHFFKNGVLLIISLLFYAWGEPRYVLIMLISIVVDYIASNGIEGTQQLWAKRLFLTFSVLMNMGFLMTFKYMDFFIGNLNRVPHIELMPLGLTLPLGISFYTFQTMSYTLDVYKGKIKAEKNIIDFGAYVCLFPQLIAGPIVKYVDIQKELKDRKIKLHQVSEGIRYFVMGLASKVVIANAMGMLWEDVQAIGVMNVSMAMAWLGVIGYGFQIYFDFSGYSLMAIGLGKMLGFEFPKNFDFPYMSTSVTEFWRRWHITLGDWFREYVYIPLGGNRKGLKRQRFNLFIVWFLTGFWHGASWNFILWGLYFALFLIIEKQFLLKWLHHHKIISHIYAMTVVIFGWVIFATPNLTEMCLYVYKMFSFHGGQDYLYALNTYGMTFILAILFSTPWVKKVYEGYAHRLVPVGTALMILFLISVSYLVDSSFNPFLYFRF